MSAPNPSYVTLARIVRPQGRRGEVAAEILTDFPERLKKLKSAFLWDGKSAPRKIAIRGCWLSVSRGGQAIFHFEGSDSINDAERFVGLQVQVPMSERVSLPEGSYFVTDLIGCEVWTEKAERVGVVRDVQATGESAPGTPLLVVDSPRGELLIPLAQEICSKIDFANRRIEIIPPEGLLDLNS
ncbi:MAG: ribosome maturation factor RimM [Candidatus Acidiferrales bacterium]